MEEVITGFQNGIYEMCLSISIIINEMTNTVHSNIVFAAFPLQ